METLYDCVVVANGSFPQTAGPLELLKATPVIIACDGAVQNLHERGLVPSAIGRRPGQYSIGNAPAICRPYPYRGRPGDKRPDQGCTFRPRFRLPENTDSRSYGTSRRPYTRKYLPADRLCSSIRSRGNALRLRSLHPCPPNNNAYHAHPASKYPSFPCIPAEK